GRRVPALAERPLGVLLLRCLLAGVPARGLPPRAAFVCRTTAQVRRLARGNPAHRGRRARVTRPPATCPGAGAPDHGTRRGRPDVRHVNSEARYLRETADRE